MALIGKSLVKKSQLTLFAILGIALLVIIFLFFTLKEKNIKDDISREPAKSDELLAISKIVKEYSEQCLCITIDKGIEKYGMIDSEKEIAYFIKNHYLECIDGYSIITERVSGITIGELKPSINITGNKVSADIDAEVVISREGQKTTLYSFSCEKEIPEPFEDPLRGYDKLFYGVYYKEEHRDSPRPLNLFYVKIDLDNPNISFMVTPYIAPSRMTTSSFLQAYGLSLAINGGGHGEVPPYEVNGYSAYEGAAYSAPEFLPWETIYITYDNKVKFMPPAPSNMRFAISGFNLVIEEGKLPERLTAGNPGYKEAYDNLEPRTSAGIDEEYNWLNLIVIDGRDPGISEGVTLKELGEIHLQNNAAKAINMDGGGSSTLVINNPKILGQKIMNKPSDGSERPVANHLGIYAAQAD